MRDEFGFSQTANTENKRSLLNCRGCVIRRKVQKAKGNNFVKLDVFVIKSEKLQKHRALRNKIAPCLLPLCSTTPVPCCQHSNKQDMHLCNTIKILGWKLAVVLLMSLPITGYGQCPTVLGILVDGCGTEQLNEFVIIHSGGGFNTNDLQFSFDVNNNIIGPENNDINMDLNNLPGGACGLQAGDPSMISGCSNVISIGTGFDVPANSMVVLQTSSGANQPYNFSSICGAGGCIYVIQSTCTRSAGGFTNAGAGTRTSILATATGCSNSYTYNQASLVGGNGAYFIPPGTYGNAGCVAPPVGPAPSGPDFNDIPNPTVCGSYTLPAITGTNLTGNESYYNAPNGGGVQFFPGEVISGTTTLYIYDASSACSDQESFVITINPAPATAPAGPLSACANAMGQATFNLTGLNNTVNAGSGQAVTWYTNMAATIPVGTPAAFTTGTTTVYAVVGTMPCVSAPVAVQLNVTPAPTANPAGPLSVCDNGSGQATFNLTTLNNTVNGGMGTVTWYTNMAATIPVGTPAAFTTGTTTVYAVVGTMPCVSAPQAVQLNVTPLPPANPANLQACGNAMGQATFNLTSINNTVTGGGPGTVNWWTTAGATTPIANPSAFVVNTPGGNAFATVTNNGCTSDNVALITITVNATPTANPAGPLQACDQGGGQATFNLNSLNNTINGGSGTVNWFTNPGATNPVANPNSYTAGSGIVYATVTGPGPCTSSPLPVSIIVAAPPTALPTSLTECATVGNAATFNLTDANNAVNGGTGNTVTWYSNIGGTIVIPNPTSFTTTTVTVYARVDNGACQSAPVAVQLVVNPLPVANPTTFNVCVVSLIPPVAIYDLPGTINTINGSTGNAVNWYTNAAGTIPLDINNVTSLPSTVFATVTNAAGCESLTVAVPVVVVFAPPASPASAQACDQGGGQATFNLTALNGTINQGQPNAVSYYSNMAATIPIANPASFTSGSTTVYAVVMGASGCNAAPVAVTLTVTPAPVGVPTSMSACNTGGGQATFNLTNVNGIVNGGTGGTVTWYTNMAATNPIPNPNAFTSGPATVYATITQNGCTSQAVAVTLNIVPQPPTAPASLSACDNGSGLASFNLNTLNSTVNAGSGNAVMWYTNMAATNPVPNPTFFVSGSTTVYAVVSDGFCNAQPVAVQLTVTPAPTAIPTSLSACNNGSGQGTFNLTAANLTVNGGTANLVNWYLNAGATMPINTPATFISGATTVYAVVDNGTCVSAPVPVTLTLLAAPVANPASLQQCATSGNQATFNLNSVNNTVNGGSGNMVDWYSNAAGTTPIGNPAAFISGSVTVYARVTSGQCTSAPVAVTLTVTPLPVASPASLQVCGSGTASFNLTTVNTTVNGGTGNPVNWFTNANGTGPIANPSNFTSGTATVFAVVTNAGCSSPPVAVTLTVSPAFTLSLVVAQAITCNSATNGSLNLTVTGGAMPFNYDWNVNPLDGIQDPTGLGAGTYSVTVTDANGCQNNTSIVLNQPAALNISCAQASPVSTVGGNDGSASVAISGGTAPYSVAWSGAASGSQAQAIAGTATITGLIAGSYNVTVTDANNCMTTCSFVISDPSCNVSVSATFENPTCEGSNNGTIDLTATGAFPFDYDWNDNTLDGTEDPMSVSAGTYSVTVTDDDGCQAITSITLTDPPGLVLSCTQANPVSVPGGSDGAATISISGGTAPYTLLWAGPVGGTQQAFVAGDATISNLPAGVYTMTVTDDNGCSEACSFTISSAGCALDVVIISAVISPCFSAQNGSIVLDVLNATGVLQYDWNVDSLDGEPDLVGLTAGFYAVTVTDEAGCSDTISVTLSTPDPILETCEAISPASGPSASDGSAQISYANGLAPYTITIDRAGGGYNDTIVSGMDSTILFNDLPPGAYTVAVLDANNCPSPCGFVICGGLEVALSSENETCPGAGDGSAIATVTGGFAPYSILWSTAELSDTIINLSPGIYTISIMDILGCTLTDSVEIFAAIPLELQCGQQTPVSTPVASDGEAAIIIDGGTAPYNLDWSGAGSGSQVVNMADTVIIGGLVAGVYSLTLTDANGCTETCSFTIAAPGCNISAAAFGQNETCPGSQDGGVELTITGGVLPFTFDWNDDALDGTEDPTGLSPGTYSVTVTDGAGCLALADATIITQNALPDATVAAGTAICEDDCFDFALTLSGVAPFTVNYTLDAGSGPQALSATFASTTGVIPVCPADFNLTNGTITLTLNDISDANCSIILDASSSITVNPHSTATVSPTLCPGESIVVNGNTYDENRLIGTEIIEGVNTAGCDSIISVSISFFPPAAGSFSETLCAGETVTIGGTTFNEANPSGTAILPNASVNGCDSSILVSLTFIQPVMADLSPTLCPGENVVVNGVTYDENTPIGQETLIAASGCDSIVNIQLSYHPASVNNLAQTLCEGEQLVVNGTVYDQNNPGGTEIVAGGSANGCDSTIVVALQFIPPVMENLNLDLCSSEQVIVNGTVYDQNNPTGTELIPNGSANGCDSTVVVALTFFPEPTTNQNPTLCDGEQLVVNGTIYNQNNPSGTEILQTVNGCDSTVVVNLSFHPAVSTQIIPTLCFGESLTVNGTVYNSTNPSGTEVVIGGAATGCDSTILVDLSFSVPITATIEGNASICTGGTATLTFRLLGETAFNVTYSNGISPPVTLNNISDGETITVSPGATSTYTILSATAIGNACPVTISGSAIVSVSNLAVQGLVTSDFQGFGVSCPGSEDGSATVLPLGGLPPYTYLWSDGQMGAEAEGLAAATYTVTMTDAGGCTGTASVTLTAAPQVTASVSGISPLCFGDRDGSILIESLNGGSGPYAFSMDGNVFQPLPAALPFAIANLGAGIYDLTIRDVNGCAASVTAEVVAQQELMLDLGEDRTIKLGDSTLIRGQVNFDIAQLQWTPTLNLSTPDASDSYANPIESTAYRLTAEDANGCSVSDVVMIFVNKTRSVYVPNVFSPNGDGLNDLFTVFAGSDVLEIKGFIIFDRWGNMLYQKGPFPPNDLQYGWDGTFEGREMNAGVYVYYAEVVFADGFTEVFKGDLILMR